MTKYEKPFKNINEQITFLEQRGLIIEDIKIARRFLSNISYYHLAVYMKPFQSNDDNFEDGTTFGDVLNLYIFDKKLRLLLLDMLERIEISLKNALIYEVSKKTDDIFWYTNIHNFEIPESSEQKSDEQKFFESLLSKAKTSKENYIEHYYENYSVPEYPPSWMFFESLSFGQSSKLLSLLNLSNQNEVAGKYKLHPEINSKWFRSLSFLRNICAHHSRLWNRRFTFGASGSKTKYKPCFLAVNNKSLFAYLIILEIYLKTFNPTSSWKDRLEELISEHNIEISKMGFPDNWKEILNNL